MIPGISYKQRHKELTKLGLAEQGLYLALAAAQIHNGPIEDNDKALARHLGESPNRYRKIKNSLIQSGVIQVQNGFIKIVLFEREIETHIANVHARQDGKHRSKPSVEAKASEPTGGILKPSKVPSRDEAIPAPITTYAENASKAFGNIVDLQDDYSYETAPNGPATVPAQNARHVFNKNSDLNAEEEICGNPDNVPPNIDGPVFNKNNNLGLEEEKAPRAGAWDKELLTNVRNNLVPSSVLDKSSPEPSNSIPLFTNVHNGGDAGISKNNLENARGDLNSPNPADLDLPEKPSWAIGLDFGWDDEFEMEYRLTARALIWKKLVPKFESFVSSNNRKNARRIIGARLKHHHPVAVLLALIKTMEYRRDDPVAYLIGVSGKIEPEKLDRVRRRHRAKRLEMIVRFGTDQRLIKASDGSDEIGTEYFTGSGGDGALAYMKNGSCRGGFEPLSGWAA